MNKHHSRGTTGVAAVTFMRACARAFARFGRSGKHFLASRRGNTAMIFALAAIPMFIAAGTAVDLSRALIVRQRLGHALDAAALAVGRDVTLTTQQQMYQVAHDFFIANYPASELGVPSDVIVTPTSKGVKLKATADVETTLMQIVGLDKLTVNASNEVVRATTRLRVALALDTTGSMNSDGKISALKTATKSLLDQLQATVNNPGDVYVSIIPFSRDINVGPSNYPASWIDWTAWDAANGQNQQSCTGRGRRRTCTNTWVPDNHNTWNGCIMDRGTDTPPGTSTGYDQKVDPPQVGNTATLYPADQYSYCSPAIMPLSENWAAMKSLVDGLYPAGSTNQPIGLVWGWLSLVGNVPLSAPAMDPNFQYYQVIILLSDGLNTQDRWYGNGYSTSTQVDARMYDGGGGGTCKNVKDSGVIVYTVQVNTGGDPISTLLQNCASDSTKFFHLTSASQIITTFNQIGTELSQLRLAQ